jgi:hypothetical protein
MPQVASHRRPILRAAARRGWQTLLQRRRPKRTHLAIVNGQPLRRMHQGAQLGLRVPALRPYSGTVPFCLNFSS